MFLIPTTLLSVKQKVHRAVESFWAEGRQLQVGRRDREA